MNYAYLCAGLTGQGGSCAHLLDANNIHSQFPQHLKQIEYTVNAFRRTVIPETLHRNERLEQDAKTKRSSKQWHDMLVSKYLRTVYWLSTGQDSCFMLTAAVQLLYSSKIEMTGNKMRRKTKQSANLYVLYIHNTRMGILTYS